MRAKPLKRRGCLSVALALTCCLSLELAPRSVLAKPGRARGVAPERVAKARRPTGRVVRRVQARKRLRSLRPARRLRRVGKIRGFYPPARPTAAAESKLPAMPLYHIHHRELARIRLYDARGRLRPAAFRRFARLLRCAHTNRARRIHWRLLVVLYDLWLHFGQPQVTVFSGNRPQVVARLQSSKHVTGHAIDFNFDGVSNSRIRSYLMRHFNQVGIGFYPNAYHVHLDVRPKKTQWIDYGGPGAEALYSRNPARDIRLGLARRGRHPRGTDSQSPARRGRSAVGQSRGKTGRAVRR